MKIRTGKLTNTQQEILDHFFKHIGVIQVYEIVRYLWPRSRQQMKKSNTVRRHLRELERRGHIRRIGAKDQWIRSRN